MQDRSIPDARWINQELDIRQVAAKLGIRGNGKRYHCWRHENHSNGDADPSVGYWERCNRFKCFVCARVAIGPIDMVMEYLNLDFVAAIGWIAERFQVPQIPVRKPTAARDRMLMPVCIGEGPIDFLVRSHIYSRLSPLARQIAPVLISFAERTQASAQGCWTLEMSYGALKRYSGLKSPNAIRKALIELAIIGWLHPDLPERDGLLRKTGSFTITPFSDELIELGNSFALDQRREIEYERECAQRRRVERQRLFRALKNG